MHLDRLFLRNFRNFKKKEFLFPEKSVVFEGPNGIGKTNILEAIYLLCTGKSQKKARKSDIIHFDERFFFIEGEFSSKESFRQTVGLGFDREKKASYSLNNIKCENFLEWFGCRPVISFSSDDIFLVYGSPEYRRRFLDLFGSLLDPSYLKIVLEYRFWLDRKNRLLRGNFDEIQCDLYDEKLAFSGAELFFRRVENFNILKKYFSRFYKEISGISEHAEIRYNSTFKGVYSSINRCKNVFYTMIRSNRKKDRSLGFSSFGPHRDNFVFYLNEKYAKHFCSQGQCRTLSLSLKLSSCICLEDRIKERIIYLVDDTVSDLDSFRTGRFFPLIKDRGQLFVAIPEGKFSFSDEFHFCDFQVD